MIFWCFQVVEKGRIGNEWVKESGKLTSLCEDLSYAVTKVSFGKAHTLTFTTESLPRKVELINPLIPGGNKKGHTYLNKPAAEGCRFV